MLGQRFGDKEYVVTILKDVEDEVNRVIGLGLAVERKEMPLAEAKKLMAQALFTDKYSERVSVYSIGTYSREVCAGPHVGNTSDVGKFNIIKEEAVAAGVRRIEGVAGTAALKAITEEEDIIMPTWIVLLKGFIGDRRLPQIPSLALSEIPATPRILPIIFTLEFMQTEEQSIPFHF